MQQYVAQLHPKIDLKWTPLSTPCENRFVNNQQLFDAKAMELRLSCTNPSIYKR